MSVYTSDQLSKRSKIIQSHKHFGNFLNANITNTLIKLFDMSYNNGIDKRKIINYIKGERKKKKLNSSNVTIVSEAYGGKGNPTLFLGIKKKGNEILHLTIHMRTTRLEPELAGIIHMVKDIYTKHINETDKYKLYTLITVQPIKHKSLYFSIADGYDTPVITSMDRTTFIGYESDIKREMNVIITVLNRIFDEDDTEYYIGNSYSIYSVHHNTNEILEGINRSTTHATRKNKGIFLGPLLNKKRPKYSTKPNKYPNRTKGAIKL